MNLRRWIGLGLVAIMVTSVFGCTDTKKKEPEIVAKVNGEAITSKELEDRLRVAGYYHAQLEGEAGEQVRSKMRETNLERLINEKLMIQGGKQQNITATEEEIQKRLDDMKAQVGSEEDWATALREQEVTEEILKARLADAIIMDKFASFLTQDVTVTPEEGKEYYERRKIEFVDKPAATKVRMIVCDTREQADQAMQALKQGKNFADAAREFSVETTTKAQGGDYGWNTTGMLAAEIEAAVPQVPVGEYTDIIQVGERYFIAYVEDRRTISYRPYEEAKTEAENRALLAKQTNKLAEWLAAEKEKAQIEKF